MLAPLRIVAVLAVSALLIGSTAGCAPRHAAPSSFGAPADSSSVPVTGSPDGSPPVPSPAPSGSPGGSPSAKPAGNPFLGRVPVFPPAPPATPIALPDGPNAPLYHRLKVDQPVAFLTMDDGWTQLPEAIQLMQAAHIRFTMFLIAPVAAKSPTFFKSLEQAGGVIEDHTITHPDLKGKSYSTQHHEMCDSAPTLKQTFGRQPLLFRPPFGDQDSTTLQVAHDCGYRAVVDWAETVDKGIVRYQTPDHVVKAGDIILMHFRPAFVDDVLAALNAIKAAGLTPALLEDYLAPAA